MMVPPGFKQTRALGVFDHLDRHAVLDGIARIEGLDLGEHIGRNASGSNPIDTDHRRVANRPENIVLNISVCHGSAVSHAIISAHIPKASQLVEQIASGQRCWQRDDVRVIRMKTEATLRLIRHETVERSLQRFDAATLRTGQVAALRLVSVQAIQLNAGRGSRSRKRHQLPWIVDQRMGLGSIGNRAVKVFRVGKPCYDDRAGLLGGMAAPETLPLKAIVDFRDSAIARIVGARST